MFSIFVILTTVLLVADAAFPRVNTTLGVVLGATTRIHNVDVNVYRGIPFAATTAGKNRFRPPQPRTPWTKPRICRTNGPGCLSPHHNADVAKVQSEDCLNLNIFCPTSSVNVPVMFWIFGGAFNEGMNGGPLNLYDGTSLAATQDVCVVSTNYRLGVLGFFSSPEQSGNQAILDQIAALEFVRDNIANFGGDPNSVTIWGQSAGAMSVSIHLVSPKSKGLFHRAILESPVAAFRYQRDASQELTFGKTFAVMSGCDNVQNVSCLRDLGARDAITLGERVAGNIWDGLIDRVLESGAIEDAFAMQWAPVVDGETLTDQPLTMLKRGEWNAVPILIGTNQDEGATFLYAGIKEWLPEFLFPLAMDSIFGSSAQKVIAFYKDASLHWHDTRDSLSYVLTDYWFKCSSEQIALAADRANMSSFVYRFDHVISFPQLYPAFGLPTVCENRTCHASEIPFVFGNFANYTHTQEEVDLSKDFASFWTSFAQNGDVNSKGDASISWPAFNESFRLNMRMATPKRSIESTTTGQRGPGVLPTAGVCAFFDSIGYAY